MKTIKINQMTAYALDKSIAKWEKVYTDPMNIMGIGVSGCGLCELYNTVSKKTACVGCPIRKDTGKVWCFNTPYKEYEDYCNETGQENFKPEISALVKAELDYLLDLKSRCVITDQ